MRRKVFFINGITKGRGKCSCKGLCCINMRLSLKPRPKLRGRNLEGETWRAQQAAPLQCAICAAKPRGSKLLRCGAKRPVAAFAGTRVYLLTLIFFDEGRNWASAPHSAGVYSHASLAHASFGPRLFTGTLCILFLRPRRRGIALLKPWGSAQGHLCSKAVLKTNGP